MILGIDAGNKNTKVVTKEGAFLFDSCLGDGRELKFQNDYQDLMKGVYNGKSFFAGELAEKESYYPRRSMGLSKAHEDMKLRVLIALHRFSNEQHNRIIVGQPIKRHTADEKKRIKDFLQGSHQLSLNGLQKTIVIESVEVGAEGAAIFWCRPQPGKIRIVEIGSGTTNIATIEDGRFIDKESDTLSFGSLSHGGDLEAIAYSIRSQMTKICDYNDEIQIAGGDGAELHEYIAQQYPKAKLFRPAHKGETLHSLFATACGLYELAKVVYGDE